MGWAYWSRCDLFLAIRVLAIGETTAEEAGCCLHIILEKLDLYTDPECGKNFFWNDEEFSIIDRIAFTMKNIIGNEFPATSGDRAINDPQWIEIIDLARKVLPIFMKNGLGPLELE